MRIKELVEKYTPEKLFMNNIREVASSLPEVRLMEVCGTHTMSIARNGIKHLLPGNIKLISGPGCPVCVSTAEQIDQSIEMAKRYDVSVLTFGDMLRVPGSNGDSLANLRLRGHDIRVIYSPLDCLRIAEENPSRKYLFLSVGFETTAPIAAATIIKARDMKLHNLFFFSMHKLIPPAMEELLLDENCNIDGFICPGHVSAIIGLNPYTELSNKYGAPCTVTGFEAIDVLQGIEMLLDQIVNGANADIQYKRCVKSEGNQTALNIMGTVFDTVKAGWRGIGTIKDSGLSIKEEFSLFDAEIAFSVPVKPADQKTKCICGQILKGIKSPSDCSLMNKACFPDRPIGPCMVSSEGACAAYYKYENIRLAA